MTGKPMTKADIGIVAELQARNDPPPSDPLCERAAAIITEMVEALEEIKREYRQHGAAAIDVMFTIADETLAKVSGK